MDDPAREEPETETDDTDDLDVEDLDLGAEEVEAVKGGSAGEDGPGYWLKGT
jgi:hypothetical protein